MQARTVLCVFGVLVLAAGLPSRQSAKSLLSTATTTTLQSEPTTEAPEPGAPETNGTAIPKSLENSPVLNNVTDFGSSVESGFSNFTSNSSDFINDFGSALPPSMQPNKTDSDPFGSNNGSNPFEIDSSSNSSSDPFNGAFGPNNGSDPFNGAFGPNNGSDPFNGAFGPNNGSDPFADPFGPNNGSDPFGGAFGSDNSTNPFDGINGPANDADPFGMNNNGSDPFADMYGSANDTDPFGTGGNSSDPFGGMYGSENGSDPFGGAFSGDNSTDPFGGMYGAGNDTDPFGTGGNSSNPFGGMYGSENGSDPFGGAFSGDNGTDPFAGMYGSENGSDPFGGAFSGENGTDPFAGMDSSNSSDPFAGMGSPDNSSDPFAGMGSPDNSSDPFAGMNSADNSTDPFAGMGSTDNSTDPFAGSNSGSDPLAGSNSGSDPLAGSNSGSDPLAGSNSGSDPFAGSNSGSDPFAGSNSGSDPLAGSNSGSDPLAGSNSGSDPFAGMPSKAKLVQQKSHFFGNRMPASSLEATAMAGQHIHKLSTTEHHIPILIAVNSQANHAAARQAIRNTWGSAQNQVRFNFALKFFVGERAVSSKSIATALQQEKDVIFVNHVHDDQLSRTSKSISMYSWGFDQGFDYMLKVDDNTFVRLDKLEAFIERHTQKNMVAGLLVRHSRNSKDQKSKWFMFDQFPHDTLPTFAVGSAVLLSRPALQSIANQRSTLTQYRMDDAALGIWLENTSTEFVAMPVSMHQHKISAETVAVGPVTVGEMGRLNSEPSGAGMVLEACNDPCACPGSPQFSTEKCVHK